MTIAFKDAYEDAFDNIIDSAKGGRGRTSSDALDIKGGILRVLLLEGLTPRFEVRHTVWDTSPDSPTFPLYIVRKKRDERLVVGADFGDWGAFVKGRRIIRASYKEVNSYRSASENWTILEVTDQFKGRGWKERMITEALRLTQSL